MTHMLLLLLLAAAARGSDADQHIPPFSYLKQRPKPHVFYPKLDGNDATPPLVSQCTVHWFNVTLDHFSWVCTPRGVVFSVFAPYIHSIHTTPIQHPRPPHTTTSAPFPCAISYASNIGVAIPMANQVQYSSTLAMRLMLRST